MQQLTRNQNKVIAALIAYPDQETAAQALHIQHGSFRNTLHRARTRAKAHSTPHLVHLWTLAKIAEEITTNI